MMWRYSESADRQARIGFEILARTPPPRTHFTAALQFLTDEIPQSLVLLHHEEMIGPLGKQTLAHAFPQLLEGVAVLARYGDGSINKVVQRRTGVDLAVP